MKSNARVVVIGGGIGGVSTLYHLAQEGWSDVVLVERDELTSGSTWHAAAQVTQFGSNQTMVALKRHSIDLYRELASDPEYPINYHITGGMRLAYTPTQVDIYRHYIGMAAGVGVDMEFIDADEVGNRHPLIRTHELLGAWWDPLDGDIDPAQLVFALARRARQAGAEIYRFNPVEAITRKRSGEFLVHTKNGIICCEMIVNASGYRVNEVGEMIGVSHPVVSMEHMYFLTEPMEEIEALDFRVPIIRDPGDNFYSRQEKAGLLVGVYEQDCRLFGIDGIDPNFSRSLCPSDLDRCLDNMERIFQRLPGLTEVGIHTVVNGPITYSADGAPLVGPIPGIPNAFACLGLRAGIGEGGGLGKILAQIMVNGECEWDAWYLDPSRFTSWASIEATCQKAVEEYQREFDYHLPHEFRPVARQLRTTPLYEVLDQQNCEWGVVNGWERVLFFKPYSEFVDQHSYRFTPTQQVVLQEVAGICDSVGLMEVSGFNRYEIRGKGARAFLDFMTCSTIPQRDGSVRLCYFLTENGNILTEATLTRLSEDHYWYGSAAAAEWHDRDWLQKFMPDSVQLVEKTQTHTTLVLAGPQSRQLLQSTFPEIDWSHKTLPPMHARFVQFGAIELLAMRVSYSGELAYELHVPNEYLISIYQLLMESGECLELVQFGLYAAESMRLEKGYLHWKLDLLYEFNPIEAGLERFVRIDRDDFVGKEELHKAVNQEAQKRLVVMSVDCSHAPAHSGDPVSCDGKIVGSVTSGGYGFRVQKNIAYAYLDSNFADTETELQIGILGELHSAQVGHSCLYDPRNLRLKV